LLRDLELKSQKIKKKIEPDEFDFDFSNKEQIKKPVKRMSKDDFFDLEENSMQSGIKAKNVEMITNKDFDF
jgi:hypothetical protein